jgi:diguanylate cyclase
LHRPSKPHRKRQNRQPYTQLFRQPGTSTKARTSPSNSNGPEPLAPREAESSSGAPWRRLSHPGDELAPVVLDSLPLPPRLPSLAAIDPEQSEHDILYALPDSPEPSYSSVAKHIEDTCSACSTT